MLKQWEDKVLKILSKLPTETRKEMEHSTPKLMPQWVSFFDKIYVINLDSRPDRLTEIARELSNYNIPFERRDAIEDLVDGRNGIYQTLFYLFNDCYQAGMQNVLILEDDAVVVDPDIHEIMARCLEQLPTDYDQFMLGLNPLIPFDKFYSPNLLPVRMSYALHASAYSRSFMEKFLKADKELPVDLMIAKQIMVDYKSYCSYPMLVNQRLSKSSIDKNKYGPTTPGILPYWNTECKCVDWGKFMEDQYTKALKFLIKDNG